MEDDDDQSTYFEPVISYSSNLTTRGVKEISNTKYNSLKNNNKINSSNTSKASSYYNTIMLPFIISDGSINNDINNNLENIDSTPQNNIYSNNYYINFDNGRMKTLSSKSENENNEEIIKSKTPKTTKDSKDVFSKRLSLNLPKNSYEELIAFKSNNYDSDYANKYNKKYDIEFKNSIRTENGKNYQMTNEKIPSLFLRTIKTEKIKDNKEKDKNNFIFKNKKRKKRLESQKFSTKISKLSTGLKKREKDNEALFFLEKSKSFSNESVNQKIQGTYKKDKKVSLSGEGKHNENNNCKSNKNLKNMSNEDLIKKVYTTKVGEKSKSIIKAEKKKNKKTNRKISFKEHNINNKLVKMMFNRNVEVKNNKYESSALKVNRNNINTRTFAEKKEDEINKKETSRKTKKKRTNSKDKNENSDKNIRCEDRRSSGFLVKEEVIKKIFDKDLNNNKDKKYARRERSKNFDSDNNDSKNELNKLKSNNSIKNSNNNLLVIISRRKRSISLRYKDSNMKQLTEALKAKLPKKSNILNTTSTTAVTKRKKSRKKSEVEVFLKNDLKENQYNLFNKFTNTVFSGPDFSKYIIGCFELIIDLDKDTQVRLKTKINFNFPKSKKKGLKKRIALFDLDETLVHCTGDVNTSKISYQHLIEIQLPGKQLVKVGINLRPLWKETLDLVKKKYHIVIHTASHQAYADAVLDFMDPQKKYFKYRLYRNNCSLVDIEGAKFYVKDLDIFDEYYDLKDIVIIDNSILSFAYHLYNGIPIVPYYEGDKDSFLYIVGLYLDHIYKAKDLREANKKLINLDYFDQIARNKLENNQSNMDDYIIDEESDVNEEDEENEEKSKKVEQDIENTKKGDETKKSKKSRHKSERSTQTHKFYRRGNNSPLSARRSFQDFSEKKIMVNSNLFHIYLDFTDKGNSMFNKNYSLTGKSAKRENALDKINFTNFIKLAKSDKNVNNDNNKDIDCKSQPDVRHVYIMNKINFEDNDYISVKNSKNYRKMLTLSDGDSFANRMRNDLIGNLEKIKSNFSTKFQDLENKKEN